MDLLSRWRRTAVRRDILSALSDGAEVTLRELTRATPRCLMLVLRELRYLIALGFIRLRKEKPCTTGRKTKLYYRINPNIAPFIAPAIQRSRHSAQPSPTPERRAAATDRR